MNHLNQIIIDMFLKVIKESMDIRIDMMSMQKVTVVMKSLYKMIKKEINNLVIILVHIERLIKNKLELLMIV